MSDVHKEDMSVLEAHHLDVTKAVMFRTVSNDFQPGETLDYDVLLFFSPAGIESLKKNFPDFQQDREHSIYLGAFGPTAVKAIEDAGFRVDIAAPSAQHRSMTGALDAFLGEMRDKEK